jgi:zinc protease
VTGVQTCALPIFYSDGATAKEITAAKNYLTGALPLTSTSTDKIAAMLAFMQRESLGRDYLDRYAKLIRAVSEEDVARAIERWFDPNDAVLVAVGKPEHFYPSDLQSRELIRQ